MQEVLTSRPQHFHNRSDVFGFGVMLWALTNGTKPWPGLSAVKAAHRHVSGDRLSQPDSALADAGLWGIMQRCWAHNVAERPSMAEVRDELAARLDAVSTTPASAGKPPRPPQPPAPLATIAVVRAAEIAANGQQASADGEYVLPADRQVQIRHYQADGAAVADKKSTEETREKLPQQSEQEKAAEGDEQVDSDYEYEYVHWQADTAASAREGALQQQLTSKDTEIALLRKMLAAEKRGGE